MLRPFGDRAFFFASKLGSSVSRERSPADMIRGEVGTELVTEYDDRPLDRAGRFGVVGIS